jgi:hypothetical protein
METIVDQLSHILTCVTHVVVYKSVRKFGTFKYPSNPNHTPIMVCNTKRCQALIIRPYLPVLRRDESGELRYMLLRYNMVIYSVY